MTNKKILVCILTVGLVSTLVTAATFTWLSDREEISWTTQVKTADLEAPESISFPELAPGESASVEITVNNIGEVTLDVTLSLLSEEPLVTFTFDPNGFALEPGGSQTVTVTATLSIEYQDSGALLEGTLIVDGVQQP